MPDTRPAAYKPAAAAGILVVFLLFLCSCGEMDSLFPVEKTYQVSAAVSRVSIDEYALIKRGDSIRPFFVQPVGDDPDLMGLRVILKNAAGDELDTSFLYQNEVPSDAETENPEENLEENPESARLFFVEKMSGHLPAFSLPEDLEPGAYWMTFEAFGESEKLIVKTEKSFYYLADRNYEIDDIKVSLPGFSSSPYLIPPGTPVLLEAIISADEGLDPYIVWYNGKTRISGGSCSHGAGSFIWDIPDGVAFLNLRAEIIPFPPLADSAGLSPKSLLRGKVKTLSLPISEKAVISGKFAPLLESLAAGENAMALSHYFFEGNLRDALALYGETGLVPDTAENEVDKKISWLSSGYIFGAAAGPGDVYLSPPFSIAAGLQKMSRFRIMLNFSCLSDGLIFTVFFNGGRIDLSHEEENLVLGISAGEMSSEAVMPFPGPAKFFALPVDLAFGNNRVEAVLGENKIHLDSLPGPPGDSAFFRLGGSSPEEGSTGSEALGEIPNEGEDFAEGEAVPELALAGEKDLPPPPVMILDELALLRFPDLPAGETAETDLSASEPNSNDGLSR